jgi:hypothetical protein
MSKSGHHTEFQYHILLMLEFAAPEVLRDRHVGIIVVIFLISI